MRRTIGCVVGAAAVAGFLAARDGWSAPIDKSAAVDPRAAAKIELGRRLFFDSAVSRTGRHSCASCHDPEHGFTDVANPSSDDAGPSKRRSMTVADVPDAPLHSDGEFKDVRALVSARLKPFGDLRLQHDASLAAFGFVVDPYTQLVSPAPAFARVTDRVAEGGLYDAAFEAAFGDRATTLDRVIDALEAYTYSIRTSTNAVDRYLAGDHDALTDSPQRGLALFTGKAGCATCHVTTLEGGRAALHDAKFHDVGVSWRSAKLAGMNDPDDGDSGLGAHGKTTSDRRRDHMRFRTPSLRDVAKRGPFMHDGSLRTLIDVIEFFDKGGERHPGLDPAIKPLGLSDAEKEDLLAFLMALSGPERAGLSDAPTSVGRTTTVRLLKPDGAPLSGAMLTIEPAGDRFRGAPVAGGARSIPTDEYGRAAFAFPQATHVKLRVDGYVVEGGRLLPDCAQDVELTAVPIDMLALRVLGGGDADSQIRAQPAAVADEIGRPKKRAEGEPIVFTPARRLSDHEGLYVARAPKVPASARRTLVPRCASMHMIFSQADIDVSPGGWTFLDMRPTRDASTSGEPDAHHGR
jgi:cytochrome c peroxidase